MFTETLFGDLSVSDNDTEEAFTLKYVLIESYSSSDGNNRSNRYGFKVIKDCGSNLCEVSQVVHFSDNKNETVELLKTLYNNSVTPLCVFEILDCLIQCS